MTYTENLGEIEVNLEHNASLCIKSRVVDLRVNWHSCCIYEVSYRRPNDAGDHRVIVESDWYPPSFQIHFTPEDFDKAFELFPDAPKNKRKDCYKPYYENYELSRGMFDFGDDELFQAYKDPYDEIEKVYLVNRFFTHGTPSTGTEVLGLYFDDFKKLKEFIDITRPQIF